MPKSSTMHLRVGAAIGLCIAALLLVGQIASAAAPIELHAGRMSMVFDVDNAMLRYVKLGEHEVLRGISAPIRDQNWGTVRPVVSNVRLDKQTDRFTVTFDVACREGGIDFRWKGTIAGNQNGEVEFGFDGAAHSTFLRNRIGICVLHAASAAGKPWVIKHVSGEESKGAFPVLISPHQPAKEIRGVAHEVEKNVWAHVEFEGEVFEMEDQRNWTDASFKTYCIPLGLPFPVEVKEGTKVAQKVRIRVVGEPPAMASRDGRVVLTLGKRESKLPRIGLAVSSETRKFSPGQIQRLKELRLDHLRVDVRAGEDSAAEKLKAADRDAKSLGVALHAGLLFGSRPGEEPEEESKRFVEALKNAGPNVGLFCVNVTDWRQLAALRGRLKALAPKAHVAGAKGVNFVDLNRDRPSLDGLDFISFAVNPQIHAFDDASLVETLPIHGDVVVSAQEFAGDRKVMVGPITLRPPLSGQTNVRDAIPSDVDVRQGKAITAAWTVGSIKYLAEAGADRATFFETVGWKGVVDLDRGAARPKGFPAATGDVFPVYHVLRAVGDFAGGSVRQLDTSDSLAVVGLALTNGGKTRLLVANMTPGKQSIELRGLDADVKVSTLVCEEATPAATGSRDSRAVRADDVKGGLRLDLSPREILSIDFQSK